MRLLKITLILLLYVFVKENFFLEKILFIQVMFCHIMKDERWPLES